MDYELLYKLSLIDREILRIDKLLSNKDVPEKLNLMKKDYDILKTKFNSTTASIKEKSESALQYSEKIEALGKEVSLKEANLYSTSSMKTIAACQKAIEILKKDITANEDKAYNIYEEIEGLKSENISSLKESKRIRLIYNKLKEEYLENKKGLDEEKSSLLAERSRISSAISRETLEDYENIRKAKGYGMSLLIGEICSGCGINVPCIIINEVRNTRQLRKCPNCGRFIYID